jgi:hypothetical protein
MALFRMNCPGCQRPSLLGPGAVCQNRLRSGKICGYWLTIKYEDGTTKYQDKMEKHTQSPTILKGNDIYSWVADSGTYTFCQQNVMEQGSVHLDTLYNYLFLWATPSGNYPLATVMYGAAGTIGWASGVVMPLNSKIQNLHHFYDNYQSHFKLVTDGPALEIEAPTASQPLYSVHSSGSLIYTYDPATKTEWRL